MYSKLPVAWYPRKFENMHTCQEAYMLCHDMVKLAYFGAKHYGAVWHLLGVILEWCLIILKDGFKVAAQHLDTSCKLCKHNKGSATLDKCILFWKYNWGWKLLDSKLANHQAAT